MTIEHVEIQPGEIHAPHNWRVPDAVTREALAVTAAELGMYCWQQDDDTQWFLASVTPVVWKPCGAGGAAAGAFAIANNLSELAADPAAQEAAQTNLGLGAADPLAHYILAKA